MLLHGILVAHQDQESASLTGPEAGGTRVVDPHLLPGQRAELGEADQFEGIQTQIDPAGYGHVEIAYGQGRTGRTHRQQ